MSGILLSFLVYFYVSIVLILYQNCDFTRIDILRLSHQFYVYLLVIDITNENRRSILNSIPIENKGEKDSNKYDVTSHDIYNNVCWQYIS